MIQSNPIQSDSIQSNTTQSNTIQSNTIQFNTIQSNPIRTFDTIYHLPHTHNTHYNVAIVHWKKECETITSFVAYSYFPNPEIVIGTPHLIEFDVETVTMQCDIQ